MVDETHGIEVGIDSAPAEAGKQRVIRSLVEIKAAVDRVAAESVKANEKTASGFDRVIAAEARSRVTLREIRDEAARAGRAGEAAGLAISRGFSRTNVNLRQLNTQLTQLVAESTQLNRTLAAQPRAPFNGATRSAQSFGSSLSQLRNLLLGLGTISLGRDIADTAVKFRGFDQALRIITGSQAGASREMGVAAKIANDLGFRVQTVTSSYVAFSAASRGTSLEGAKSAEIFKAITKAAAGYGLSNDDLRGSLLAVQQMMSKGQVQAEELRGQLGERLPGAFQIAARAMGVTTSQLSKMLEAGQVVSEDFLPKFAAQLNKEIPDGVRAAGAGFSSFMTELDRAKVALADGGLFQGLTSGAKSLADTLQTMSSGGQLAAIGSALGTILSTVASLAPILPSLVAGWAAYKTAVLLAEAATALLNGTMLLSPVGLVAAALALLVVQLGSNSSAADGLKASVDQVNTAHDAYNLAVQDGTSLTQENTVALIQNATAAADAAKAARDAARAKLGDLKSQTEYNGSNALKVAGNSILDTLVPGRGLSRIKDVAALEHQIKAADKAIAAMDDSLAKMKLPPALGEVPKVIGGTGASVLALAKAQAALNAATTPLQKATAQLSLDTLKGAASVKAGTMTVDQYTASLTADRQAIQAARDAVRGHTQALSDHRKVVTQAAQDEGKLAAIRARYDDQPRYLDQADKDKKTLSDMVGKWVQVGDAVVRYTDAMRDADLGQIDQGMSKPFNDLIQAGEAELANMALVLQGRRAEAAALREKLNYERQFGAMLPAEYQELLKVTAAQERMGELLDDQREMIGRYLQTVGDVRNAFEQMLDGLTKNPLKAAGNFVKDLGKSFKQTIIRSISADLFGGLDREIENFITGRSGVQDAVDVLRDQTVNAGDAAEDLAAALRGSSAKIQTAMGIDPSSYSLTRDSGGGGGKAGLAGVAATVAAVLPTIANDNETVVNGRRNKGGGLADPGPSAVFGKIIDRVVGKSGSTLTKLWSGVPKSIRGSLSSVGKTIEGGLSKIGVKLPKSLSGIGSTLGKAFKGASEGAFASSIVKSLGVKQSATGAKIGGAIGKLGLGPLGGLVGGLIGGTLGGLFKKTSKGGVTLSGSDLGNVSSSGGFGKESIQAAASGTAADVQGGLAQIAKALGGTVGAFGNVTIGTYGKQNEWRVNTTGGQTLGGSKSAIPGVQYFASGEEGRAQAIAAVIGLAVKQGAIQGISEASKRVLAGSTTEATINAAATYEDLLRQVLKLKDPIAGAFDELKRGLEGTIQQLRQAGYSLDDISKLQTVFEQQQKDTLAQLSSGYEQFLKDITDGPNSGKTIYNQFLDAQKTFGEAQAGLANGTTTQDQFTSAGQNLFDLARQTYGTATPEFEAIKASLVQATQGAIDKVKQTADVSGVVQVVQATATAAAVQRDTTNELLQQIANAVSNDGGDAGYYGNTDAARQAY